MILLFFFFFFQAEDGIRDGHVTGVQTCALPISAGGGDQILMCTAGSGWYQAEGEEPVSMVPGTVIRVPAGTKHWHGAKGDAWFSHLAFITPGEAIDNDWLGPVSDGEYDRLRRKRGGRC